MRVLYLKASLRNGISSVWRTFEVSEHLSFAQLHEVLQILFGYLNREGYEFFSEGEKWRFTSDESLVGTAKFLKSEAGKAYLESVSKEDFKDDLSIEVASSQDRQIGFYLTEGKKITYLYDFSDEWLIDITCLASLFGETKVKLIDGFGTAVYEGVGGVAGYQDLMDILADVENDAYDEVRLWLYKEGYRRYDKDEVRKQLAIWEEERL